MIDTQELSSELLFYTDPEKLNEILVANFIKPMPGHPQTVADMEEISCLMDKVVGYLQFLVPNLSILKIKTQNLKAQGHKEDYRLMMQRRDVVDAICEILEKQRETLSRMITIKQEINKEIAMY